MHCFPENDAGGGFFFLFLNTFVCKTMQYWKISDFLFMCSNIWDTRKQPNNKKQTRWWQMVAKLN